MLEGVQFHYPSYLVVDRDNIFCYLLFSTNNGREGQV
jgi:hypothetical protein